MNRPSPLALLIVILWADARLWPPAAQARLPETRALAQHAGLLVPAREHNVITPEHHTFRRLLAAASGELQAIPHGVELQWLMTLLEVQLAVARHGGP